MLRNKFFLQVDERSPVVSSIERALSGYRGLAGFVSGSRLVATVGGITCDRQRHVSSDLTSLDSDDGLIPDEESACSMDNREFNWTDAITECLEGVHSFDKGSLLKMICRDTLININISIDSASSGVSPYSSSGLRLHNKAPNWISKAKDGA
ncbi:uncharacterized protein EAE97_004914 [Botrytis byssoidea]|uniref:Uncharacterized protein n=1 Tax=Botrytis byssoidea TaxID=139641 RepID=A0A9P5M0B9_9HELO|nr:uncharacterized protein EAE97_004914 [Botrytis byssoidea]KAF7945876.1 hypothetical protein EAE97_004914 [Botrytis byssoidea]